MADYLHIHCGPHQLLLDAGYVVEVADCRAAERRDDMAHRPWRELRLPVLDLAHFLGVHNGHRQQQIVIADDLHTGRGDRILEVDRVERLVALDAGSFVEVAAATPALDDLVDGVWRDGDRCLLRIRHPFAWQSAAAAPEIPEGSPS